MKIMKKSRCIKTTSSMHSVILDSIIEAETLCVIDVTHGLQGRLTWVLWLLAEPWLEAEPPRDLESLRLPAALLPDRDGRGMCHSCDEIWNYNINKHEILILNTNIRMDLILSTSFYVNLSVASPETIEMDVFRPPRHFKHWLMKVLSFLNFHYLRDKLEMFL